MYKAIICDGDRVHLQDLRQNIAWTQLGTELCGCCSDGYTARILLEKEKPDILICGVHMIGAGGLELAELAKRLNPRVRVILISDMEDFNCAVRAIRLGVHDFLCKPVSTPLIQETLSQAVEDFHRQEQAQALISEGERNTRKAQIQCLVFEGLRAFEERYGIAARQRMQNMSSQICIISIDNFEPTNPRYTDESKAEINRRFFRNLEQLEDRMTIFEKQHGSATCFFLGPNTNAVAHTRGECLRRIREGFRECCPDMTITFALSTIRPNALDLQKSHREAQAAMQERFVRAPGSEIYYDRIRSTDDIFSSELEGVPAVTDLVAEIRRGNRNGVRDEIEKLGKKMQEIGGRSHLFMKFYSGNIFFSIQQDLQQYGINLSQLDLNLMREYQQVTEMQNMNQVMRQLYSFCARIMDALEQNGSNNGTRAVAKARAYIDENYADHSLNMDDVASHVHMSPSYFSVIFKQETGISFTDYLISLRIRKSKELIRNSNLKIYEIASRAGYDTAAYYSTAFKKETGLSPSEYKKKYLNSRENSHSSGSRS